MGKRWSIVIATMQPVTETVSIEPVDEDNDKFWAMDQAYDYAFDVLGWDDVEIMRFEEHND